MRKLLYHRLAIVAMMAGGHAYAADSAIPVSASAVINHDWSGFYVGGHSGYGGGGFGPGTNPILGQGVFFPPTVTGLVGGYQAGYNFQLSNHVIVGLEADVSFPSPIDRAATGIEPFNTRLDYFGTARGRIGYAVGSFLPYVTGGIAWGQMEIDLNDESGNPISTNSATYVGWTAGVGIEYAINRHWSAKFEYNYVDLNGKMFVLDAAPSVLSIDPKLHVLKLGLNYKLWEPTALGVSNPPVLEAPAPQSYNWNIHGQTTFIQQGYPRFRSPYEGPNSLPGGGQGRETWTTTAFIGWRLWEGGEFYFNPELDQGFGLARTLGLGGFSNGEAQKAGTEFPKFRAQRYFLRQTFGLGGEEGNSRGRSQSATREQIHP